MGKDGTEGASGKLTKLINLDGARSHHGGGRPYDFASVHAAADDLLIECLEAAAAGKFTKDQAKSFIREYKRMAREYFQYA